MPSTFKIIFGNQSGTDNKFAFFVKAPELSPNRGNYYSNVWISRWVPNGGYFDIMTTDQFYGWTGYSAQGFALGVVVSGGDGVPVNLAMPSMRGSNLPMTTQDQWAFFKPDLNDCSASFNYGIQTDDSFEHGQGYGIGLGQTDDNGQIVPVATSEAYPVLAYTLAPSVKYLVAVSNDRQGTCVDIDALSLDPAIIDFSSGQGQGNTTAIVTVDSSNNFTVKYSA